MMVTIATLCQSHSSVRTRDSYYVMAVLEGYILCDTDVIGSWMLSVCMQDSYQTLSDGDVRTSDWIRHRYLTVHVSLYNIRRTR